MSIIGARPQFIKASPVSKKLRGSGFNELLVHTGQHYDSNMSDVFFEELKIPLPEINLGIGSGSHGWQTAKMLMALEELIVEHKPDFIIVYGDTNSTLAGALAACKAHIPLAHVEAGLRSFNRGMPEEHNRVLTDHCSELLFCPTKVAVDNLSREGIENGVHFVGDTMLDSILEFTPIAERRSTILKELQVTPKSYYLLTVHRAYNTDNISNLSNILDALKAFNKPVIFPVHPRTNALLNKMEDLETNRKIHFINPVGYLDMLVLEKYAELILTDSGGVQKEAFFFEVPCVTLRTETEWLETVNSGWNVVTGAHSQRIIQAVFDIKWPTSKPEKLFGGGDAAFRIVNILSQKIN